MRRSSWALLRVWSWLQSGDERIKIVRDGLRGFLGFIGGCSWSLFLFCGLRRVSAAAPSTLAVPSTPGCWVCFPSVRPSQPSAYWVPTLSECMQCAYGESNCNAARGCSVYEGRRRHAYNTWCGTSNTETYFVPVTHKCMPKSASTPDDGYPDFPMPPILTRERMDVQTCSTTCLTGGRKGPSGGGVVYF